MTLQFFGFVSAHFHHMIEKVIQGQQEVLEAFKQSGSVTMASLGLTPVMNNERQGVDWMQFNPVVCKMFSKSIQIKK